MDAIPKKSLWNNESANENRRPYRQRSWKYDPLLWDRLAQVMDLANPELLHHSIRVANLAAKIAQRLGLTEKQVELIIRVSLFHDIGKLGLSQTILSKPGPLAPLEYESIKTHPDLGAALLRECSDSHSLIPIVRHHHEYFDGNGYPDGIRGSQIEIEARIISIADAIDSMRSERPYRQALSLPQIIRELRRCAGTQFDPLVVETAIVILVETDSKQSTDSKPL